MRRSQVRCPSSDHRISALSAVLFLAVTKAGSSWATRWLIHAVPEGSPNTGQLDSKTLCEIVGSAEKEAGRWIEPI